MQTVVINRRPTMGEIRVKVRLKNNGRRIRYGAMGNWRRTRFARYEDRCDGGYRRGAVRRAKRSRRAARGGYSRPTRSPNTLTVAKRRSG